MLIVMAGYQYAPSPCFEDHNKLKLESGIFHQYISTEKYQSLVDVNVMIINMIPKLGYNFTFMFWIWIPLMTVIYYNIFDILTF